MFSEFLKKFFKPSDKQKEFDKRLARQRTSIDGLEKRIRKLEGRYGELNNKDNGRCGRSLGEKK